MRYSTIIVACNQKGLSNEPAVGGISWSKSGDLLYVLEAGLEGARGQGGLRATKAAVAL